MSLTFAVRSIAGRGTRSARRIETDIGVTIPERTSGESRKLHACRLQPLCQAYHVYYSEYLPRFFFLPTVEGLESYVEIVLLFLYSCYLAGLLHVPRFLPSEPPNEAFCRVSVTHSDGCAGRIFRYARHDVRPRPHTCHGYAFRNRTPKRSGFRDGSLR